MNNSVVAGCLNIKSQFSALSVESLIGGVLQLKLFLCLLCVANVIRVMELQVIEARFIALGQKGENCYI